MKSNNILSSELPEIDDSIKECVNFGQWLLFKSHGIKHEAKDTIFYLKTGSKIFCLSKKGEILETIEKDLNVQIDELFYFSDIAHPQSLSNMVAT